MTEKPERGKQPEDNGAEKDSDAIQWEELDFDELLGEEEPEKERRKDTAEGEAAAAVPESDTAMGDVVEDIDDLLDVTEEGAEAAPEAEPEEISVDDLLDVEEPSKREEAAETVAETPREIDIDELLADDLVASDEEGRSDVEELLADDFLAEEVAEEGVPASEETAEVEPEGGEETADAAPIPAQDKKGRGLKKIGKKSGALAKKERVAKKGKPEKKDRRLGKAKERAAPREPKPSGVSAGAITFVCSECYEELLLSPTYGQDVVTCPECLHVGKRPDDDFLRTVRMHKSGERRSLLAAVACGALLVVLILAFFWTHSPYTEKAPADNLTLGLLGGSGVLALVFLWLIWRFEGNRWEVYF